MAVVGLHNRVGSIRSGISQCETLWARRERSIPAYITTSSWNGVQSNIGKFQRLFGMGNMIIVDNNSAGENVFNTVFKQIVKLTKRKVKNYIAKQWIDNQLRMKRVMGALTNR